MKMDALLTQLAGAGPQPRWAQQEATRSADGAGFADALRALSQATEPAAGTPNTAAPIDVQQLATQPLSVLKLAHEPLQPQSAGDLQTVEVEAALTDAATGADAEAEPMTASLLALMQAPAELRGTSGVPAPAADLTPRAALTGPPLSGARGADAATEAAAIISAQPAAPATPQPTFAGTAHAAAMPMTVPADSGEPSPHLTIAATAQASLQAATETATIAGDSDALPNNVRANPIALPDGAHGNAATPAPTSSLTAATTTVNGMAQPAQATLSTPLQSPDWGRDLGTQLVQMTQRGDQQITLQLNPQDLGPMSVELRVADQLAQLSLLASNAQVRGALEQALPQLREALAEQGITLGEANVGESGAEARDHDDGRPSAMLAGQPGTTTDDSATTVHDGIDAATRNLEAGRINLYI